MSNRIAMLVGAAFVALLLASCGGDDGDAGPDLVEMLFGAQDNELRVYNLETEESTILISSDDYNVNGQPCLYPDGSGNFLMGEDIGQSEGARQGWGIFTPDGEFVRKILEPETEGEASQPEPFGCAFDAENRMFVTDVGTGSFDAEDGKLIVFFPPSYDDFCVLDTTLKTAGTVAIDDAGDVYVPQTVPPGQVLKFEGPFPANGEECETFAVNRSVFIEDPDMSTPIGIAATPSGGWYICSVVIPPTIREYDADGNFIRVIAEGDDIGNPSGIAVSSDGTVYYADLGLEEVPPPDFFSPQAGKGTVRKITFDAEGNPSAPIVIDDGLSYPDAVSVLEQPRE